MKIFNKYLNRGEIMNLYGFKPEQVNKAGIYIKDLEGNTYVPAKCNKLQRWIKTNLIKWKEK